MGEHPYTRKDANPNEAAEDDFGDSKKDGIGFDLMSFHAHILSCTERIASLERGFFGESFKPKCLSLLDLGVRARREM